MQPRILLREPIHTFLNELKLLHQEYVVLLKFLLVTLPIHFLQPQILILLLQLVDGVL